MNRLSPATLTIPPRAAFATFFNFPFAADLDRLQADIAIMGLPYGDPYSADEVTNDQTNAPTAVRQASPRLSVGLDHWDFDIGGTLFDSKDIRVVDVGDVAMYPDDPGGHYRRAELAARKIFSAGARLISIGGDHGVPIPVFRALDVAGPVTLVQIDAHLDWRDEVNGVREGYSSPIRRASEMPHIRRIVQIGMRGQGSARRGELDAARTWGAEIVTAWELQDRGMADVLAGIPDGERYYLSIDADGLDPSVMPAVAAPAPGGVSYRDAITLIKGLCRKGTLLGMDVVEITPKRDVNEITAITAGYFILNAIGAIARSDLSPRTP
jgi:agmatinase